MRCFTVDYRLLVEGAHRSDDEKLAILADYENGVSVKQLEMKYGYDRTNIGRLLDSFGMERQNAKAKKDLLKAFENDHEVSGVDLRAFCKLSGMAYTTAEAALERAGKVIVKRERISQDIKDKAVALYKRGKGLTEISKLLGIPPANVRVVCIKAGLIKTALTVTPHVQRILDYIEVCKNKPVYKTAGEMAGDLKITEKALTSVLGRFKVTRPDMKAILMSWLELNSDPSTGFIKPIHHRTLAGLLNIGRDMLRNIIYSNPHWSLVYENGVIRDTRDISDTSFLYQDDDWGFESDQDSFDDVDFVDFVEPAPVSRRRSEVKLPRVSSGLRRSKPSEG